MRAALVLARRGLGIVWPNPAVGCVIVNNEQIVGRGWTQPGGRPHAETEALRRAGSRAKGACAYVSLEPCNHYGQTPPCTKALLEAGIARVVTSLEDPDPRTSGSGHERLRENGVEVVTDVLKEEAQSVNDGFLTLLEKGRPKVTLKTATTLDGMIAAKGGASQWITGSEARARGHALRASHDAIMIGIGTALADKPALTCRIPGMTDRSPVRVVVDSTLRLPLESELVETANDTPTWIITSGRTSGAEKFRESGVKIVTADTDSKGRIAMPAALKALGNEGLTRILVEGGHALTGSLLSEDLIDEIVWFRASGIMGSDGVSAVASYGVSAPDQMKRFKRVGMTMVGEDVMERFERA